MIYSEIDAQGFFVRAHDVTDYEPRGTNWVELAPPVGSAPFYLYAGVTWIEQDTGPTALPAPYEPLRISKIDFARLFRGVQEDQINKWEKICKSLTPESYDDPANTLTLTVERVLKAFERPLEYIELNHPETAQALQLLAFVGVFGEDPVVAAAEIERILAGQLPA